jgi:hypothetical protein
VHIQTDDGLQFHTLTNMFEMKRLKKEKSRVPDDGKEVDR